MPGIDVRMMTYGERVPAQERYNSEESLEDNQSTSSSTESRQSDFAKKEHEFIPTRSSGILAGKPATNAGQFTRINSNPLLISAQKQMLKVEDAKKKKVEVKVGEDIPDWQSNLDGWKLKRRKQSEDAIVRVSEMKRVSDQEFDSAGNRRKSSLGRKISLQIENDDQIDFDDLGDEEEAREDRREDRREEDKRSRGSRGLSQEKVIPEEQERDEEQEQDQEEEDEEEEEEEEEVIAAKEEREEELRAVGGTKANNPYESAIEGYRSFALSQHPPSAPLSASSKESSPSSGTSSLSSASSPPRKEDLRKGEEEWQEKIDTFVQPARRVSSEVSDAMRQKMASFTGGPAAARPEAKEPSPPARAVITGNKFHDKLKAFKTIEETTVATPGPPMSRRESEPALSRARQPAPPRPSLAASSSSSSFMNTIQNAKFFQQNSLGSEEPEEEDNQAVEDALEESFNVLEDGGRSETEAETLVFSADDFSPLAPGGSLPPAEKPPPLPPQAPPAPPPQETEIDKQEREIIESLEQEEQEQKQYLESLTGGREGPGAGPVEGPGAGPRPWSGGPARQGAPARRKERESRDYSKHWLIQEAEQRRIAEANQKQNLPLSSPPGGGFEKIENMNNNQSPAVDKRREVAVSDNIYANVDVAAAAGFQAGGRGPQIPGPQVPPRTGEAERQERVLSVSGKKRCSHCKEELGRGAAMIIESLRLFYHIRCFKCCVCSIQLGNGEQGTDVRVRNNRLHCQNCYSNDEGLKFSKV